MIHINNIILYGSYPMEQIVDHVFMAHSYHLNTLRKPMLEQQILKS